MSENIVNKLTLPSSSGLSNYQIIKEYTSNGYLMYQADMGIMHLVQSFSGGNDLNTLDFNKIYVASRILIGHSDPLDTITFYISGYTTPQHVLLQQPIDVYDDIFNFNTTLFVTRYVFNQETQSQDSEYFSVPMAVRWFEEKLFFEFPETITKQDGSTLKFSEKCPSLWRVNTTLQLIK